MSNEHYLQNPLIHRDRRLGRRHTSWVNQFDCTHMRPLIICRGPIRKEAMDVFEEMGITHYGILLSEKDSIVYQDALAPELRSLTEPDRVHRVPDYTGANKEERDQRIKQIINIFTFERRNWCTKRLPTPIFRSNIAFLHHLFDPIDIGAFCVHFVDRNNQMNIGPLDKLKGFVCLRHEAIIRCDNQNGDICDIGPTLTHIGERCVARSI